ncbi:MAG: hypothetical protein LBL98_02980 [Ruminococcus sp.]|jgi:hypothetical protein|nr:hypothetical protein [Ruminococcus sp.]
MKVRLPNEFKQGGAQNMNQMILQARKMHYPRRFDTGKPGGKNNRNRKKQQHSH